MLPMRAEGHQKSVKEGKAKISFEVVQGLKDSIDYWVSAMGYENQAEFARDALRRMIMGLEEQRRDKGFRKGRFSSATENAPK